MIINDFFTNPKRSARNVAENSQRVDSLVTDALRVMKGPEISDAVLALKRVLGDREYNSRRGFYSFYVDQIHRNWQLPMYGQQNLAEDADELPPGSLGSMPTTDYVKNLYSTAAERGMAAPDPDAVKNSMALNPKGDVDVSGTFNKGIKAFQNPELTKNLNALTKLVGRAETDYINHPVATGTGNETPQMYSTPLTQKPNYLDSRPATGTGKENPRLDTRPATARPNANYDNMMQPMEAADDYPSPADVVAGMSDNTDDGPDIMRNWDRFGKNLKPDQEITPLDSEEEEAVRNHINRWQTKMNNLPDPFAGPTIYKGADGSEFSAGGSDNAALPAGPEWGPSNSWPTGMTSGEYSKLVGSGAAADDPGKSASSIAPNGWQYVLNPLFGQDKQSNSMSLDPAQQAQAARGMAAKQQANSVPAGNAVSSNGKTEPVRMSMTMGPGGGEINDVRNPNIDDATVARARAWAAKQNAPANGGATASNTTAAPAWQDLAQANKLDNPNRIYPGQKLTIPGRGQYEVQPGDTLSSIAAGNTQAAAIPKATPTAGNAQSATNPIFKQNPKLGVDFPIPPATLAKLGMAPQTKQDIAQNGRETLITPAMLRAQKQADADIAKIDAKRLSSASNRGKTVKETDMGDTMDDGFKWGSATMPMQDGSTMQYHAPTNSYKQATPPTRPDLNTNISTISRDSSTNKNSKVNQNYSDVSIATNPATGTGDYMHRQDVNGTPTTTFRQNVPAAELAKLRSQHFNEDINRMQNLAGIRKK